HADRVAIVHGAQRTTYAQLLRQAQGLAQHLARQGVRKGDRVAILARNQAGYLVTLAACELAGYVAVGLNHRLAPPELATICADCAPVLLVTDPGLAALGNQLLAQWTPARGALAMGGDAFAAACGVPPGDATRDGVVQPEDLAYLLYTSGTTGRPKGVMLGQRGLVATARSMALETGAQADDLLAAVMPLFHIGARCKTLGYALRGAGVLLVEQFQPADYLAQTRGAGATAWHLAPSMLQSVLETLAQEPAGTALPPLRAIHYAAAPMPLPVLRDALERFGPVLRQYYGMTETGAAGTVLAASDHRLPVAGEPVDAILSSAGQAGLDVEVRIARDDGTDAAVFEAGEVEIRSAANMLGYWNQPAATAQALHAGWMRTGDIGTLDARGYLAVLDRKKDMLISGGENIYPREVEDALLSHPAVAEAAVIGRPDAHWGEAVQAWVVLRPQATADEGALIAHVRGRIASYKKPKEVRFVPGLPRLATGKVDKKALRALAAAAATNEQGDPQ
ncbi:MAG: AMP-dependent synthetase and ligase, partial [Comamonadaceae bacterium]